MNAITATMLTRWLESRGWVYLESHDRWERPMPEGGSVAITPDAAMMCVDRDGFEVFARLADHRAKYGEYRPD